MSTNYINAENIGNIVLTRVQGRNHLVGSTIPADTYVNLRITNGKVVSDEFDRELFRPGNNDNHIVDIQMTHAQWGELISSFGVGTGAVCTIARRDGEDVAQTYKSPNLETFYADQLKTQLDSVTASLNNTFKQANAILKNKKAISKADREVLASSYIELMRLFTDSAPFLSKRLAEDIEQQLHRAQAQFKANVEHTMSAQLNCTQAMSSLEPEIKLN